MQANIQLYKRDQGLLDALLQQANKDFQAFEDPLFKADTGMSWNSMVEVLEPLIDRLVNLDSERFFRLLYTIDVDEQRVKQILFGPQEQKTSWSLSVLILERELLKVVTKKYFSKSIE